MLGAAVILVAAGAVGCSNDDSPSGPSASGTGSPAALSERLEAGPSALAQRLFDDSELDLIIGVGEEMGLDWAILAAANEIETAGRGAADGAEGRERVAAIGFTIAALGAPTDYAAALATRGGQAFARRTLALAERLRGDGGDGVELPLSRLPFGVPVDGQLVAGFGKRFGALHDGLDIAAPSGNPIAAIAPGLVLSTGFDPAYGNRTCLLHRIEGKGDRTSLTTCYGNQSRFEVEPGDTVKAGETIGLVGCSGPCLRPHVHLQVLRGSAESAPAVDPATYLAVGSTQIGTRYSLETE